MKRYFALLGVMFLLSGSSPVYTEPAPEIRPQVQLEQDMTCSAEYMDTVAQRFNQTTHKLLKNKR